MRIKKEDIGEILQQIYDSELHFRLEWMWDAGIAYAEGSSMFDEQYIRNGNTTNIVEAFEEITEHLCKEYPDSEFTKWFKSKEQ